MKRFALDTLIRWKNKPARKPMIIRGARQVGKTWLMREFGRARYESVAYVMFENNPRMRGLFSQDIDVRRILTGLELESGQKIALRCSVLSGFFDSDIETIQAA
jgi:predicted AAA+ superfamily ATPase